MALIFHLPFFFLRRWSLALEARVIACIMLFWVVEDFLWFILNPAFGLERFDPSHVTWHKHWFWGAPVDYWVSSVLAAVLLCYSLRDERRSPAEG